MKPNSDDFNELCRYAALDGTEIGGYVSELLCLRDHSEPHGMSTEFSTALNKELNSWLTRFKTETRIVRRSEPWPDRQFEVLIWMDD